MKGRIVGIGTFVGGAALIAGEVAHAALRRLPMNEGFDLSATFGEASRPRLRLAVLGDSTVTGQGLDDPDDSWPRVIARHLAGRFRVELRSYGEGGARSRDVLEAQVPRAEQAQHDLVIVSVGSNDILRMAPPWRMERRLCEIVSRMQRVAPAVILFGVGDLGSIPRLMWPIDRIASRSGRVADWVHRRVAAQRAAAKVDMWALTTEAFNSGRHMFAPDLFHPSPEGQRVWAGAMLPTIESELRRIGLLADQSGDVAGEWIKPSVRP